VRKLKSLLLAISLLVLVAPLSAQTKGIATFGGLKNLEFVNDFYNGGKGSLGSGPGKDLQLQFASNAQVIVSASKGGSGNFINNPGAYPVMFFQTGKDVVMTATAGVSVGLWFSYSALQPGTATVYDGPNGAGNILASITLSPNNSGCNTYKMCIWSPVGVTLTTPAGSIRFSGAANFLVIGAIHLGVKLPTSTVLTSSQNPSVQGQSVTFTATVSATGAVPIGTVRFKTGNVIVGEIPVVSGTASITLSNLPVGPTKISAIFRGAGFVTSTATLIQTVN
jgi:Bacterial Ig-like domain (group 3)